MEIKINLILKGEVTLDHAVNERMLKKMANKVLEDLDTVNVECMKVGKSTVATITASDCADYNPTPIYNEIKEQFHQSNFDCKLVDMDVTIETECEKFEMRLNNGALAER